MNEVPEARPADSNELAQERTGLAFERTVIAAERTLMAWIRTSVSLIGFGFTIYKFLQYLREAEGVVRPIRPYAPRNFGLALILLGIVALIGAVWQHRQFMKRIGATDTRHLWSLSVITAILVAVIGVLATLGVLVRTGPF